MFVTALCSPVIVRQRPSLVGEALAVPCIEIVNVASGTGQLRKNVFLEEDHIRVSVGFVALHGS